MQIETQPFELSPAPGRVVRGRLQVASRALAGGQAVVTRLPAVILIHGFASFMQWGFFPWLSRRLVEAGFVSVRFDMSGNGVGSDLESFDEPEAFAHNTYGKELEDLAAVRRHLASGAFPFVDAERISLLGHSRGAGIGLLHAGEVSGLRSIVAWGTIVEVASWTAEKKRLWRSQGYLDVFAHGAWRRMAPDVLDDAEARPECYDLARAFGRVACPVLFVHGTRDRGVPLDALAKLVGQCRPGLAQLVPVEGAGHTFGARHPLEEPAPTLLRATELSLNALRALDE